jgi:hypothetical protein
MFLTMVLYYCDLLFGLYPSTLCFSTKYTTIMHIYISHGCETWSLILLEELRLTMFENKVLKRLFGPKREEETGRWGKLHNKDYHNLQFTRNIIRMTKSRGKKCVGIVARVTE